ncbi:condensin complex subunit 1, partial [Asbolus verrucosus]
ITYDNFDDFQNIVSEWIPKGILDNSVIDKCWQYYTQRAPVSNEDARAAAELLRMAAIGRHTIITKNINVVTTVAFSDKFKDDMMFLACSCRLLAVAGVDKIDIQSKDPPFKMKHADPIFQNLSNILVENFFKKVPYYSEAMQSGLDFIFRVCSKPTEVCEKILKKIHEKLKQSQKTLLLTTRFCQLLGYLAIKMLGFLDNTVYRELKRRNYLREARKENDKNKTNRRRTSKKTTNSRNNNDSCLMGAEAEDTDAEFILNVLENYVVSNSGVIGQYYSYLVNICQRPDLYNNPLLQQAAVIALMRYMLISSKFCRDNIRLLFTIFEKTTFPELKRTILVHCSDLLTRFPNIVEPWSPRIYGGLKDPRVEVRKTAFFALSNLILRDMIRAHSHISEMAACLIDEKQEMRNMCKTFFGRLAQKENNLANVIPDIFSHLVKLEEVSEENLRFIMKFLFDLVDNSKRTENLVDRFCCKYTPNEDFKLNRNITYCLSLINYNDKALRKLHEKFPLYKHHVHDAEIYSTFQQILTECSKQKVGRADLKPIITDIENCIASVFEMNEDGPPVKPPPVAKPPKKTRSKSNRKKSSKRQTQTSDSDFDSDVDQIPKNKKQKRTTSRRNRKSGSDSD